MTKCFHLKHSWMVCLHLYRCPRQKKKKKKKPTTPCKEGQATIRVCVSGEISQSPGHRAASICAYCKSVDQSEWEQLHRNDQDCRGIIILEAGTNNRLRRSKKYCSVLDWACRWDCELKKKTFQRRGIGIEESPKGQSAENCIFPRYGQFDDYMSLSHDCESPGFSMCSFQAESDSSIN